MKIRVQSVGDTTWIEFNTRRLRKWANQAMDIVNLGLTLVIAAAVMAVIIIGCMADSLPTDVIMRGLIISAATGLVAGLIKRELQ